MFFFQFFAPQEPSAQLAMLRDDPDTPLPAVALPTGDASAVNAIAAHLGRQGGGLCFVGLDELWQPTGLEGFGAQLAALARAAGPDRSIVIEASPEPEDAWVAVRVVPKASIGESSSDQPLASDSHGSPAPGQLPGDDPSAVPLPDMLDLDPQPLNPGALEALGERTPAGLHRCGVVDSTGRPTIAGAVAALSKEEDAVAIPALCVQVSRYDHALEEHGSGQRAAEARLFDPPAAEAIPTMAELLTLASPMLSRHQQASRETLAELLVNAIVHRSYEPDQLEKLTQVQLFTDALRISNPCTTRPGSAVEDRFLPWPEATNPTLMALLTRLGLAHDRGLGLAKARAHVRDAGMSVDLEVEDGWVHVTLRFCAATEGRGALGAEVAPRPRRKRIPADERQRLLIETLESLGVASSRELSEALDWPAPTVRVVLQRLQEQGRVHQLDPSPRSPTQRYGLTDPSTTDH